MFYIPGVPDLKAGLTSPYTTPVLLAYIYDSSEVSLLQLHQKLRFFQALLTTVGLVIIN